MGEVEVVSSVYMVVSGDGAFGEAAEEKKPPNTSKVPSGRTWAACPKRPAGALVVLVRGEKAGDPLLTTALKRYASGKPI